MTIRKIVYDAVNGVAVKDGMAEAFARHDG